MRNFAWAACAALGVLATAPSVSAEIIRGTSFGYGNWEGAAYTNDQTGAFSHCVVSARYRSGDTLFLSVTEGATVVIGVSNPALRLREGESFPVVIRIDSRRPFVARANAIGGDFVKLEIQDFERALNAVQRGLTMRVDGDNFSGVYSLRGTKRALDQALQCAVDNMRYAERTNSGQPAQQSAVDETHLYQLATQMIASVGAQDFRYLTKHQVDELGFSGGVFWVSEQLDIIGGTMALAAPGSLRETDASDLSFMNQMCRGDFASHARQIETGRLEQRELTGYCVEGEERSQFVAVKTKYGQDVLYNVIWFGPEANSDQSVREEATGNIALRAASFVREQ